MQKFSLGLIALVATVVSLVPLTGSAVATDRSHPCIKAARVAGTDVVMAPKVSWINRDKGILRVQSCDANGVSGLAYVPYTRAYEFFDVDPYKAKVLRLGKVDQANVRATTGGVEYLYTKTRERH